MLTDLSFEFQLLLLLSCVNVGESPSLSLHICQMGMKMLIT